MTFERLLVCGRGGGGFRAGGAGDDELQEFRKDWERGADQDHGYFCEAVHKDIVVSVGRKKI